MKSRQALVLTCTMIIKEILSQFRLSKSIMFRLHPRFRVEREARKMVKRSFLAITTAVVTVALVFSIFLVRSRRPSYQGPVEQLSFGIPPVFYSMLPVIAEERGLFTQNGLHVRVQEYEYGALALEHLLKGDVDIAVAADFAFVSKSLDRHDLRTVASVATSGSEEIVTRKDRNITQTQDLRGKRIGVSPDTSAEFTLKRFLLFNRIPVDEVKLIDLGPAQLVEAVVSGEVDAFISWDIWVYEAKKRLGANAVSWPARIGQDFYWLAITTNTLIAKKPAALERFLRSMMQAEEFVKRNKAGAKAIFTKRWPREPAFVDYAWERCNLNVSLDQGLLTALDVEAEWRLQSRSGNKKSAPNSLHLIHMDALDAVDPKANTIFR